MTMAAEMNTGIAICNRLKPAADITTNSLSELSLESANSVPAKNAIGRMIRHFFPETPILQLGRTRPDIGGNCFVTTDSRDEVLRSVSKILRHDEIPPAAL